MSMKVAVNGTATFSCRGLGEFIRFEVNSQTINSILRKQGFDDSSPEVPDSSNPDIITRVLRVFGAIDNNGSSIVCVVFRISPFSFNRSNPAILWVFEQGMLHCYFYCCFVHIHLMSLCVYLSTKLSLLKLSLIFH